MSGPKILRGTAPLVVLLVAFLLAWDLRAIFLDQRPSGSDTITIQALQLHRLITDGSGVGLEIVMGPKGPVAPMLALVFLFVLGQATMAVRLLSVLCHGAMMLQCYDLGRRLGQSGRTGLLAALLCGTQPMVFGWCRMDHQEPLLTVLVLGAMQLMLRVRLDRWAPALGLGLLMAMGLMTKPSYVVFMTVPGLWFMARRLRSPGSILRLGGLVAMMVLAVLPWVIPIAGNLLVSYPSMAAFNPDQDYLWKALHYLGLPGTWPLFGAALLASAFLVIKQPGLRWAVALLFGTTAFSLACFVFIFDVWSRYILPLFPLCAILTALGLEHLLERLPTLPRRVVPWVLGSSLLGLFVGQNITGIAGEDQRETYLGIITPDTRPYEAMPRALMALAPYGSRVLIVHDAFVTTGFSEGLLDLYYYYGFRLDRIEKEPFDDMVREGRPISVLLIRFYTESRPAPPSEELWPPPPPGHPDLSWPLKWWNQQTRVKLLIRGEDPSGLEFSAYRVTPTPPQTP